MDSEDNVQPEIVLPQEEAQSVPSVPSRLNRSRQAVRPSFAAKVKQESIGMETQSLLLGTEKLTYDQFCQIVTTSPRLLSVLFSNRGIPTSDADSLATSLTKIAKELGSTTLLLEHLLKLEFEKASKSKTTTILRGNTLTTKCLDQFIQNNSGDYLRKVLHDPLSKLLSTEAIDLEVDPSKIKFTNDEMLKVSAVLDHMDSLKEFTDLFINAMSSEAATKEFPFEAKYVSRMIAVLAENYNWDVLPLVGSYVILRFFNPSIVFPETRNLLPPNVKVTPLSRHNLILISKVIQNLSNSIEFGIKEEYMGPMNDYIKENQDKVNDFLKRSCLSNDDYEQQRQPSQEEILTNVRQKKVGNSQDLINEAMNVQLIIEKNSKEIKQHLDETASMTGDELDNFLNRLPEISADVTSSSEPLTLTDTTTSTSTVTDSESYLKLLEKAKTLEYQDLEAMRILALHGTDSEGRPIVCMTEERIRKEDLERVILYIIQKLDKIVEQDYVMIWCVNNSANQQRPGFSWILNVYRSLARKYKKNLKKFYLIHPTFMFKIIIKCFRPFVSEKFWKKLVMVDRVQDMYKELDKRKVPLPPNILAYDYMLRSANEPTIQPSVFETSLEKVMTRPDHKGHALPVILEECFALFLQKDVAQTQGLFRISGGVSEVQKLKILYNNGDNVDLEFCDVHTITSLVKLFFRELPEPLFLYELYDSFINLFNTTQGEDAIQNNISNHAYVAPLQDLLQKLPTISYTVAKAMFHVLHEAAKYSDVNMMTCRNLAIVFGPNILRNKNDTPLSALKDNGKITLVVETIIMEYEAIFGK